jgi:hypothetical protein
MADHPDTWARIIEMARFRFPGDEPAMQAFAREAYDAEETAAYAAAQGADDEEQAVLDAAPRVAQLRGELCAKLRGEATASTATGQSARVVAHAEVLHATNVEVPDDESDDFADFDDNEDAPDLADEQRALMASFKTARRDRAFQQFMDAERHAHQEVKDMWQRHAESHAHQGTSEDMDLMARVTMDTVHARHQQEVREAAAFHEAAAARTEVDALADTAAEAAHGQDAQAQAEEAARRAHWANASEEGQARRAAKELHSQRTAQWAKPETLELTPRERRRLANLHGATSRGLLHAAALVLLAVATPVSPVGSRASDCELPP